VELWNRGIVELWNRGIGELWNCGIEGEGNNGIGEFSDVYGYFWNPEEFHIISEF